MRPVSIISVLAFALLALFALMTAHADVNLSGLCIGAAQSGKPECSNAIYDYPSDGKWVKTPGGYYFWGTIASNAAISVCASDIPRGSSACNTPTTLVKSLVPTAPPPQPSQPSGETFNVRATWVPPTLQRGDDGRDYPLAPADILAYKLVWNLDGEFVDLHYVDLPGNALSYVFTAPKARICAYITVTGRDTSSERSPTICVDPTKVSMKPYPVGGFVLTPEP